MQVYIDQIREALSGYLPSVLAALAILVVGWLVALIVGAIMRSVLRRVQLDNRLARWIGGEEAGEEGKVERWISKGAYYLVMLFVLVLFLDRLQFTPITQPINEMLDQILGYMPRLVGAGVLLFIAWVVASGLRLVVSKALEATKIDERLGGVTEEDGARVSKTLADATYWLVLLLFLPVVLDALELQALLFPLEGMFSEVLGFLPNLFAATLVLAIGWFMARIVQQIVTNVLAAVGADRLSESAGLAPVLGEQKLSGLVGLIAYVFVLIPVLIAALGALELEAVTRPASGMLDAILAAIPDIFAAVLVLTVAYLVGRVVAGLVTKLLQGIGFDNILVRLGLGKEREDGRRTPADFVGVLVMVGIVLFASIEAANLLGFALLAGLLADFVRFAGEVVTGLVIFGVGLYLANLAARVVRSSGANQANTLAWAARISILVLAGAMALRQMGLAGDIINLAFGLLLGAIALASALAFGIGGRDVAAKQLEEWRRAVQEESSG